MNNCRQVHLDFHTSPHIPGIGSKFDKSQFQAALKEGNLTSITVFAKCHHGMCYYPTKIGAMHPGLDFDLTGAMIDAAHEIGVRAPIYITAGWSETDAEQHPEWRAKNSDGDYLSNTGLYREDASPDDFRPMVTWRNMCLNDSAYCQHIYDTAEEICKRYKTVDGLFFDICFIDPYCLCDECRKGMKEMGLDTNSEADARAYYRIKHIDFMKKCGDILHRYHPKATIFFNSGGAEIEKPEYHPYETHYEMEDLPTCWGGYDKMPLNASFFSQTGKPFLGMTGKFHLDWGEFGGFKCKEALKYEIATMATYGAACSIGDHMFPDGVMDMQTYSNIGYAYRYYEELEPYIFGESTATVGVYLCEDRTANFGISKILLETQIDHSLIKNDNFHEFNTVIFPGKCKLSDDRLSRLKDYLGSGGKVLICGEALIDNGEFQIDCGLKHPISVEDECDYISPLLTLGDDLPQSPFLAYSSGIRAEKVDADIFAELLPQRFNRTYGHFCGHKNTPYVKEAKRYPAIAKKDNTVYLAHCLPSIYDQYGSIYHKRCLIDALMLLEPKLHLVADIYSQGRCRMIKQPHKNRYCINMTYASPVKRGKAEIIEDLIPIYDVPFSIDVQEEIASVYLPLRDEYLSFMIRDGRTCFVLPELNCHETVILEYKE